MILIWFVHTGYRPQHTKSMPCCSESESHSGQGSSTRWYAPWQRHNLDFKLMIVIGSDVAHFWRLNMKVVVPVGNYRRQKTQNAATKVTWTSDSNHLDATINSSSTINSSTHLLHLLVFSVVALKTSSLQKMSWGIGSRGAIWIPSCQMTSHLFYVCFLYRSYCIKTPTLSSHENCVASSIIVSISTCVVFYFLISVHNIFQCWNTLDWVYACCHF